MGVPSLNDRAVDGMLNTTNHPTLIEMNDGRVDSVIANYDDNIFSARVCQEPTHPQVYKGIKNNIFRLQWIKLWSLLKTTDFFVERKCNLSKILFFPRLFAPLYSVTLT